MGGQQMGEVGASLVASWRCPGCVLVVSWWCPGGAGGVLIIAHWPFIINLWSFIISHWSILLGPNSSVSLNGPIPIKIYKREVPIYTCVYREIHLSGLRSHCVIVPVIVHCNQLYIAMEEAVSPTIEPKKSINWSTVHCNGRSCQPDNRTEKVVSNHMCN